MKNVFPIVIVIIFMLTGCDSGNSEEEPVPEPPIYNLAGEAEGGFVIGTILVETVDGMAIALRDSATGGLFDVGMSKSQKGYGDNAILTVSEIDIVLPSSKLYWKVYGDTLHPFTPAKVGVSPTKVLKGVVEFYPNWKEDEWFYDPRQFYDLERIEFITTDVCLMETGTSSKKQLRYLYEHRIEFEKTLKFMLGMVNDMQAEEEGDQPMRVSVTVTRRPE